MAVPKQFILQVLIVKKKKNGKMEKSREAICRTVKETFTTQHKTGRSMAGAKPRNSYLRL